jgi:homogentisate 1,2-dioxygenase
LVNKDCTIDWLLQKNHCATISIKCRCRWNDFHPQGKGKLRTMLHFEYGDYLIIPRGMIYQIDFDTEETDFYVESLLLFYPKRYKTNQDNI